MEVFIYAKRERKLDRDLLEEQIEEILGNDGLVTGAGSGQEGWNIDIQIYENTQDLLTKIFQTLTQAGFTTEDYLVIDGKRQAPFTKI
ncbi:MAG: hypothetical protein H6510_12605 [Acidobacteria bacterium]|nr:hypothetical protein [Acidobacteriota bacterium]